MEESKKSAFPSLSSTGIKRVLEGEIRKAPSKAEEGKLHVKYTTVPLIPLETQYNVLETDYDNYAVLWSCSGVGPVHTQNAWIMTRQRLAPGEILQKVRDGLASPLSSI
jgi:apolipoprotein D and lipocalin family protein